MTWGRLSLGCLWVSSRLPPKRRRRAKFGAALFKGRQVQGSALVAPAGAKLPRTVIRSCTNSRRTHLDGKFSACLCQKILKYIPYSCAFLASAVKKFARQSAHFGDWYSFLVRTAKMEIIPTRQILSYGAVFSMLLQV